MAFFPPSLRFGRPVRFFFFCGGLAGWSVGAGLSTFFRGPCKLINRFGRCVYSRLRDVGLGLGMVVVVARRGFLAGAASGARTRFLWTAGTGGGGPGSIGKGMRMS